MSRVESASSGRVYGVARVCENWKISRSAIYRERDRQRGDAPPKGRRGPKRNILTDEELLQEIRTSLKNSPWVGEGYRKVFAELRARGVRTSAKRVNRIMRENDLLSPTQFRARGPQTHEGKIVTERPDVMWGTDMTSTLTDEGNAQIFFVVDHCTAECLGIHAARRGTRFEAIEALQQAVRRSFDECAEGVATELTMRHDNGSQFISKDYQRELRFLGIESSPSFVRQPQGNGCAERFVRTLKEQLLWLQRFETVEALKEALLNFARKYNESWRIARHGYVSPTAHRRALMAATVAA